ncbi:MAG: DNA primase [Bacilli bacterium]|nr:DNA primase [Bacilli bacterium]
MAFISQELINEIKSKNDIVDVIGGYINLNEKNKALCPFHNDHSPSFSVNGDKQIYKCFSCGESGNVITFVQKYNNISFQEAIKILAENAGINITLDTPKKQSAYDKYYDINDTALKYYKNNLISSVGTEAYKYLTDRGLTKELINEFNIGLSTGNKLSSMLLKKYDEVSLLSVDISKEISGNIYDTFQNRIIFPVIDEDRNVIAFSGRKYLRDDLNDNTQPKYLNTKETIIFKKGNVLYNINNSLQEIKKSKEIIITEGFMDTIRMSSIGYKNVVALMGTAFTKEHLEKIKSYKCRVVLNLDQDNAGKSATVSIGDELIKNNIDVSVIVFDDYKDSDEYIVNKGRDAFDLAYKNRISFIDFKLKYLRRNRNMSDSVEISKYINQAIESLNNIDDDILRELKINEISREFGISDSVIKGKLKDRVRKKVEVKSEVKNKRYNKYDISEIRILYLMLHYDEVINEFESSLGYLINDNMSKLAYKIIEFRNDYGYFEYSDFIDYISEFDDINVILKEIMKYPNNDEYSKDELDSYINTIKEYSVKQRISSLKQEMKETLDINKKIEIAKKIENINKEVLKW